MSKIEEVDISDHVFDIHRDLTISKRKSAFGPPKRIDGLTVGIVTMEDSAPHDGEMHPDGDEILYVISGKVRVVGDSDPNNPLELSAGQSCLISAGEWHRVEILQKTQLIHITPGPNGDHRPLANA
jgi:quercetin dioxygenase-like cupin family protein